jgi:uncharacterized protein YcbK (DUF882 family)
MRLAWLVAAAVAAAAPASAAAQPVAAPSAAAAQPVAAAATPPKPSKKDAYLAAKGAAAGEKRRRRAVIAPGKKPPAVVGIFNTWTREWLVVERDGKGSLPPEAQVDRFLRCHFTNQSTDMRNELIATLRDAARHFAAKRIDIVSGYRSPKYNLMLRKKGREVARDSQHTQGTAVDFRIPGVDVRTLEAWARGRRLGGVGLYLGSKFIHVDTGPIRAWNGT